MYKNRKIDIVPGPDSDEEMSIIYFGSNNRKINYTTAFKKSEKFSTFDENKTKSGYMNNRNEKKLFIFLSTYREN